MKHIIIKKLLFFFFLAMFIGTVFGCAKKEKELQKVKDLEYTVLEESEVPEELLKKVEEKKTGSAEIEKKEPEKKSAEVIKDFSKLPKMEEMEIS